METNRVVVGYDTSQESLVAVEWAAAVAKRRNATLLVIHAAGREISGLRPGRSRNMADQHAAQDIAEEGAKRARQIFDGNIEAIAVKQGAAAALEGYSHDASLVVVGHRGLGRLRGAFVGSVAFALAMHSACPVSVVRHSLRPLPSPEYPVVVATDGSEHSEAALREGARLATDTGSFLRIVAAWNSTPSRLGGIPYALPRELRGGTNVGSGAVYQHSTFEQASTELSETATRIAEDAVAAIQTRHPDLDVEQYVAGGRPEEVIIDAAADASIIVIGARGLNDLASLLLGSVSREVIQRADCAVYVVR